MLGRNQGARIGAMVVEDGCFAEEGARGGGLVFCERGEGVEGWRGVDGGRELHVPWRWALAASTCISPLNLKEEGD